VWHLAGGKYLKTIANNVGCIKNNCFGSYRQDLLNISDRLAGNGHG
jgi:hypothetical protein